MAMKFFGNKISKCPSLIEKKTSLSSKQFTKYSFIRSPCTSCLDYDWCMTCSRLIYDFFITCSSTCLCLIPDLFRTSSWGIHNLFVTYLLFVQKWLKLVQTGYDLYTIHLWVMHSFSWLFHDFFITCSQFDH